MEKVSFSVAASEAVGTFFGDFPKSINPWAVKNCHDSLVACGTKANSPTEY